MGGALGSIVGSLAVDNAQLSLPLWFNWRYAMRLPASAFAKLALTWGCCLNNEVLDTQAREKQAAQRLEELAAESASMASQP